ncbi:MAG: 2-amino-4-hydroxy-6-hydroxymethyldihydropteridine diphosphokinase [Actinobacteria bacterium]|nr:2-amino-4-hydroxy-6-hydroxymethyldihydropteridine diphosphokinase [Actinomycetota bacterium]
MFKIFVKNLKLYGYHGVREHEKKKGQYFLFNLKVEIGKKDFSGGDRLENTFSYSDAIRIITGINDKQRFDLLETLCQTIACSIMEYSGLVEKVTVSAEKPGPPIEEELETVGVEFVYTREEHTSGGSLMAKVKDQREGKGPAARAVRAYLSLGSNMGEREENLKEAIGMIKDDKRIDILKISSIYRTEPMYVKNQKYFYNMVIMALVDNAMGPFELLGLLKGIEYKMGRMRTFRFGPRPIDIDILDYDNMAIESDILTIPHPRMKERNFVLAPLMEIDPGYKIDGLPVGEYLDKARFPEKVQRL